MKSILLAMATAFIATSSMAYQCNLDSKFQASDFQNGDILVSYDIDSSDGYSVSGITASGKERTYKCLSYSDSLYYVSNCYLPGYGYRPSHKYPTKTDTDYIAEKKFDRASYTCN